METLNLLHSLLRWGVLAMLLFALVLAYRGKSAQTPFGRQDQMAGLVLMIFCDLQLLLGLALYLAGPLGLKNIRNNGMAFVMQDSYSRFFAIEHITGMLIALVLIHVGRARSKKAATDVLRHRAAFLFYLLALIVFLASIPWPFRKGFEGIGWI